LIKIFRYFTKFFGPSKNLSNNLSQIFYYHPFARTCQTYVFNLLGFFWCATNFKSIIEKFNIKKRV